MSFPTYLISNLPVIFLQGIYGNINILRTDCTGKRSSILGRPTHLWETNIFKYKLNCQMVIKQTMKHVRSDMSSMTSMMLTDVIFNAHYCRSQWKFVLHYVAWLYSLQTLSTISCSNSRKTHKCSGSWTRMEKSLLQLISFHEERKKQLVPSHSTWAQMEINIKRDFSHLLQYHIYLITLNMTLFIS